MPESNNRNDSPNFNHFVNALAKYDIFLAWVEKFDKQKYIIMDITKTVDVQYAHVSKEKRREGA